MKTSKIIWITLTILLVYYSDNKAQPIPVELMMGHKYGTVNLAFSKKFTEKSKLGFFHMNTVQFDYKNKEKNSFILQDLLYVETLKNLRVARGVAYSKGGFNSTSGIQYFLLQFMKSGNPNGGGLPQWPKYTTANGETMILDDVPGVQNDPDREARKFLS